MRILVLLLLLANLAFFAWWRYLAPPEEAAEPGPLTRQIDPGKLPIVPAPSEAANAKLRGASLACLEWGRFLAADLPRAEQALAALGLRAPPVPRQAEDSPWWVYIPTLGSREAALKKAAELKSLGVDDHFIVQEDGPTRWAISLGVFRSEEAANSRLEALRARRVRTAQLGKRDSQPASVWLQARELTPDQLARLRAIAGEFGDSELRECASSS